MSGNHLDVGDGRPVRVLAFTKYGPMAAATRQRLDQYLPYLRKHGVTTKTLPLLDDAYVRRLAKGGRAKLHIAILAYLKRLFSLRRVLYHDVIWVHYEMFPYLPAIFEKIILLARKPIIVDLDDAIFHTYDQHSLSIVRTILGKKLAPLLRGASICSCGNTYLLQYTSQYCSDSRVIPTVVDTTKYLPKIATSRDRHIVIGWIGSPSTWRYVAPLLTVLLPHLQSRGAKFMAVGAGPAARDIPGVEAIDWTEESEIASVQAMDIGIMPLPDEAWARGKCGYKLIQYMACGLPVIASPVGVNADIVVEGVNGFLARDKKEWLEALDRLLDEPELRSRFGREGRIRVQEHYSLASQQPRVLDMVRTAAFKGRRGEAKV